jgi:hypothetical protein
MAEPRG